MLNFKYLGLISIAGLMSACVTLPTGPSMMVLPGSSKSFQQFQYDDHYCRQYALSQLGGELPQQSAMSSGVGSAIVGAGLGAAAGAAIGGGEGAAIGAGTGLALGGLAGSDTARVSGYEAQEYYDRGYIQCMYALGHRVPISGQISDESATATRQNPILSPPPPPPPGKPPAPPQR